MASLTPSLSREDVEKKLGRLSEFLQLFQQLGRERMGDVSKILVEARLVKPEPERTPMVVASNAEERVQLLKKFGPHIRVEVVGSEAEIHEILAEEPHVLSTRPFKGVGGVTVLREAFDHLRKAVRKFRTSRVMKARIRNESYEIPESFDEDAYL